MALSRVTYLCFFNVLWQLDFIFCERQYHKPLGLLQWSTSYKCIYQTRGIDHIRKYSVALIFYLIKFSEKYSFMQSKHTHLLNELLNLLEPQKKKKKNDFDYQPKLTWSFACEYRLTDCCSSIELVNLGWNLWLMISFFSTVLILVIQINICKNNTIVWIIY